MEIEFGAGRNFGSRRGMLDDPFYALDLDKGISNAPRPYFARAVLETSGERAGKAPGVFINHWNRMSMIIGSESGTPAESDSLAPDSEPA